jgi:hypothetical protein
VPCVGLSASLQAIEDCVVQHCNDLLAQLGLNLRCQVGPIGPLPDCNVSRSDVVGSVVECVNDVCNAVVGLLGPVACAIGPIGPLPPLSCGALLNCVEQVCNTLVAPLGAACSFATPAQTAPVPPPWAADALGTAHSVSPLASPAPGIRP